MSYVLLTEARIHIERALGGIETLHCGPMDYNVAVTVDELLAASRLIKEYGSLAATQSPRKMGAAP